MITLPDIKISAAADIATLVATDMLPVARSGSSTAYKSTMAEIATWANTNLPVASTTTSGTVKVDGTSVTIAGGVISSAAAPPSSAAPPLMDSVANAGTATAWSRGDHVHPSDTSRAPLASPTFTGTPAAPTVTPASDSTTKLATTAFVQSALGAAGAGVSSWNTRAGAVVLTAADVVGVGARLSVVNLASNSGFYVNQRTYVSGTALAVGAFGHDRWKGGAGGGSYTFTQSGGPATTITITAGTLQQIVEGVSLQAGNYMLSWAGTAQGRVGAGSYAASPVTITGATVGANITIEFNAGTLGQVKLESGGTVTSWQPNLPQVELVNCQRFYSMGQVIGGGTMTAGQPIYIPYSLPITMRASPTIAITANTSTNLTTPALNPLNGRDLYTTGTATASAATNVNFQFTASADL